MKSRLSYNNYLVQPWCNVHGNNGSIGNYRLQTFQIHYNITLDGNNGSIGKEDVKLWNIQYSWQNRRSWCKYGGGLHHDYSRETYFH